MPNWVTNEITFDVSEDYEMEEIKNFMMSEECEFDFNKLVPMPSDIYRGNLGEKELKLYGKKNWYDWSCENWGTKWNACDVLWGEYEVSFETAWSPVNDLVKKLAKKFPNVPMTYYWDDYVGNSGEENFNV